MEVPHLNISIEENSLIEGAKEILSTLRPKWDLSDIRFKSFTSGHTNKLLGCFHTKNENEVLLIRVYGNKTDLLIDRKKETENIKFLCLYGLAPALYGTFTNGIVYEYTVGDTLNTVTCRLENVCTLVAQKLADLHSVKTSTTDDKEPALWNIIQKFLMHIPNKFSDNLKEQRFKNSILKRSNFVEEYAFLKEKLNSLNDSVVFCHNDLLLSNIIYNSEKSSVTFIDYEYADCNYQAFDIANHFNEFADMDNVDYSLFPDDTFQKNWIRVYLLKYLKNKNNVENIEINDEEIESLFLKVKKFTLASHFLWGLWSLIQAEHSLIQFDYLNYAFIRFTEYFKKKKEIFNI